MATRYWEFTAPPALREMPATALDAAAWILELTWPSSTSNSHKSFLLHAISHTTCLISTIQSFACECIYLWFEQVGKR